MYSGNASLYASILLLVCCPERGDGGQWEVPGETHGREPTRDADGHHTIYRRRQDGCGELYIRGQVDPSTIYIYIYVYGRL